MKGKLFAFMILIDHIMAKFLELFWPMESIEHAVDFPQTLFGK